jgi:hypothetical protein
MVTREIERRPRLTFVREAIAGDRSFVMLPKSWSSSVDTGSVRYETINGNQPHVTFAAGELKNDTLASVCTGRYGALPGLPREGRSELSRYLLIALNSPTGGERDEVDYNEWYNTTHKGDLLSVDGAQSVRRFKVLHRNRIDAGYVSVTEIEAENADVVMGQLAERASEISDKMDRSASVFVLAEELDTNG